MSDHPEPTNTVAAASGMGRALITALPPGYIVLLLLNTFFLYLVLTFTENQAEQRLAILNAVINKCLGQ